MISSTNADKYGKSVSDGKCIEHIVKHRTSKFGTSMFWMPNISELFYFTVEIIK